MGNLRSGAHRIAAFLAALGMLVMSSGIALMVMAAPANADRDHDDDDDDKKVNVCHATDSDTNPYQHLNISTNAVKDHGHLAHRSTPNKIWKTDGTWNGVHHSAGDAKPDLIEDFDGNIYDGSVTKSLCDKRGTIDPATASVQWIDPSCDNGNDAGVNQNGSHVVFSTVVGSADPGTFMKIKATAIPPYEFAGQGDDHVRYFFHTFDDVEDCTLYDATADVQFTDPECENENTASFTPTGNNVTFEITDGEVAPGEWVEITAFAEPGHAFDNEAKTKVFTYEFDEEEICDIVLPPRELTPKPPTFVDPTCDVDPSMGLPKQVLVDQIPADVDSKRAVAGPVIQTADVDGIHYEASGSLVPGGTVEVVATLIDPEATVFAPEVTTKWSHTFPVPTGCTSVAPPIVSTPSVDTKADTKTPTVVTPTVVSAGLAADVVQDARAQQGLALVLAGMVLLVCAGGLGLVRPRVGVRLR